MIARVVSVIGALLVASTLISLQPDASMWIWRRFGTFPDLEAVRQDARASWLPWKGIAVTLADGAYEKGVHAAEEEDRERKARAFREARRGAFLAYMALHGPLFAGWALIVAGGAAAARGLRKEAIDLDRLLVHFDLSRVGRVGIVLPERALPELGTAVEPACQALGLDGDDLEVFELIRRTALEHGTDSAAVGEEIGRLPARKAETFATAMRARRPVIEALRAYREKSPEGVPAALLELREELREMGELTPLRTRGLGVLAAHPRHPASIGFHGSGPGGLVEHTVAVVRRGLEMIRAGVVKAEERTALVTALLFHDIGKVVSYEERDGRFEALDRLHAQNGALVLGVMPELWEEHGDDARRILLVVGQEHDQDAIPVSMRAACEPLLAAVMEADGSVAAAEGAVSAELLAEAVNAVVSAFPSIVRDMNINGGKLSSKPDGFFDREKRALFLLEPRFRDEMTASLDPAWRRALGISFRRKSGKAHPGWLAVAEGLEMDGALPRAIVLGDRRTEVDGNHLMSVAVGKVIFQGAFPVDLEWLRSRIGKDTFEQLTFHWELNKSFPVVGAATGTDIASWRELHELLRKSAPAAGGKKSEGNSARKRKRSSNGQAARETNVGAD